ncbi:signal transducer and activator of transcription 6 isoform X2 [Microcaecilia unicolor]|uniref:Signal transducer and activator of transcription n=1 Tax=Microcaecilia unicolor TaxID=1415580 RepID=A0A6P7XQ51_9AMPH|nr:signal transducer and activator of transcription 6 isoform X2 [Microcaecilia unicolor]
MSKMTLWSIVSKMPPECFNSLYVEFPLKLRQLLGEWLENQPWEFLQGSDAFYTSTVGSILTNMMKELCGALSGRGSEDEWIPQYVNMLEALCRRNPLKMVEVFRSILEGEKAVILKQFHRLPPSFCQKQEEMKFNLAVQRLCYKLNQIHTMEESMRQSKENLPVHEGALKGQWTSQIMEAVTELENVQVQLVKRISIWKRQQQLAGNGAPFDGDLHPLQDRCESLFDVYLQLSQELVKADTELGMEHFPGVLDRLNSSLSVLVKSSFLVEHQPPQVPKTQTKFQANVRFLLGLKLFSNSAKLPLVKATVVTEKQARELVRNPVPERSSENMGDIVNNMASLELNLTTRVCGASFKNILLKKIKRCERKGSESVTEEKCAILFSTDVTLSAHNVTFHLQTFSLPLVVIVHGNQDNNAKATVLWDNAFSEVERIPFVVADLVPWPRMCEMLNLRFVSEVQTSHGLTRDHFFFLAQKIFNDSTSTAEDFQERCVSWAQFNKELLPNRGFTFWQWFDGVVDLTKKYLKNYWSDKLIIGFISKQYLQKLLLPQLDGTFLLRFSDSEIGGITIAHIQKNVDGSAQVQNIQPFCAKDLAIRSLADRIHDLKQLQYLYKEKPKDIAFKAHYTKEQSEKNSWGYVPTRITIIVEGDQSQPPPISIPAWPASPQESSQGTPTNSIHSSMYSPPTSVPISFSPIQDPNLTPPAPMRPSFPTDQSGSPVSRAPAWPACPQESSQGTTNSTIHSSVDIPVPLPPTHQLGNVSYPNILSFPWIAEDPRSPTLQDVENQMSKPMNICPLLPETELLPEDTAMDITICNSQDDINALLMENGINPMAVDAFSPLLEHNLPQTLGNECITNQNWMA